ncbi:Nucleotidyltransferase domain protein [Pyrobaculum oguniense TE7]|uniref:Nucleotidyltransferase domain protein n=1 Tax=Pyrobaculum oguniense (strain DSM 13380 / JCM 10595 / TE7) TaxID=698757 RepID=H6QBG1_PYROT|nr:Nucleotidyltransferase domain protein [Pyrobaculum oguniense TE7]
MRAPPRILEIVDRFIKGLEEAGFRVVEAYLFGSYARGDWLEESDVDLVVVSPDFEGTRWLDRLDLAAKIWLRLGLEKWVEVFPYTPEEFEEAKQRSVALRDAERYWIKVR